MSSEARDHLVCVLQMEGDQRARENGPENPATSRPRQKQTSDTVHVAVRTSVLDRKNVNEMNSERQSQVSCELMSTSVM